ncbi:MAG: amidase [Rhodospirillaceae bacterium]|nr:amidase [Rhodospirillaceae bacterium]MDE0618880.1 amidase [Rhodospirillaceae bacterium]
MMQPWELTAAAAADAIAAGNLTSEALVRACLDRIAEREATVQAWAWLDPDAAIAEARRRDAEPPRGPLHGVPVGIKDMIDTGDMPTEYNSPLYPGHRPARDAACVSILRSAGLVVLGKVATVEFASLGRTAPTRNPLDPGHTPGGSSSGSGAAVGAGMAPLALGTQTGGSVIRPASFCGVFGMKPSYGLIGTEGIKVYAQSLDTIGYMARSAEDLTRLSLVLGVVEEMPEPAALPALRIGVCRTPHRAEAAPETREAIDRAANRLAEAGAAIEAVADPPAFDGLTEAQDRIMHWEGRGAYRAEYLAQPALLHPAFRDEVENAKGRTIPQINEAYDRMAVARIEFAAAFAGYDAWLTPAVIGEAPAGLESTGEALFNRMWTALHGPCITIPAHRGPNGLPVGVQIVSPRLSDAGLLAVAEAISPVLADR